MSKFDRFLTVSLLLIAGFLAMIAIRPLFQPTATARAQSARFEHIYIVSPLFLYKGDQGLLVLDQRNANIWFIPRRDEVYQNPVFVTRLPFEKLDQSPPGQ